MKTLQSILLIFIISACAIFAQLQKEILITVDASDSLGTTIDETYPIAGFTIPDTTKIDGDYLYFQEYSEDQWIDTYNADGDRVAVAVGRGRSIKLPFIDYLNFKSKWRAVTSVEQDTIINFKVQLVK